MAAIYSKDDGRAALVELKRLAECLLPGAPVEGAEAGENEHPARSHTVRWRERLFGRLYELHPSLIESGRGAILEVDLDLLLATGWPAPRYQAPQRFPSSAFDLSVVTGLRTVYASLEAAVREAAPVDSVEYLYTYRGQPLPEDRQSVTLRVTVSASDHTLTSEEVTARREAIIARLRALGHELRG
jgi:phenylalanyl-tRNA synthetase beta chain